jgi:hypothetical protein
MIGNQYSEVECNERNNNFNFWIKNFCFLKFNSLNLIVFQMDTSYFQMEAVPRPNDGLFGAQKQLTGQAMDDNVPEKDVKAKEEEVWETKEDAVEQADDVVAQETDNKEESQEVKENKEFKDLKAVKDHEGNESVDSESDKTAMKKRSLDVAGIEAGLSIKKAKINKDSSSSDSSTGSESS